MHKNSTKYKWKEEKKQNLTQITEMGVISAKHEEKKKTEMLLWAKRTKSKLMKKKEVFFAEFIHFLYFKLILIKQTFFSFFHFDLV